MNILLILIPVTLIVIGVAVALFFWAVDHQQFDDLDSPAELPLMDDLPPATEEDEKTIRRSDFSRDALCRDPEKKHRD
jgi:cbb3-type cytochrome oxidase maturation protein